VSRSSTVVIAYLIRYAGMELYHAWNVVYKARPIIRPNIGFAAALQQYERQNRSEIDIGASKGCLDTPPSSLSLFWMSESYFYYLDYIEFMYRCAALAQ
jgi:hypothetical protein